MRLYFCLKSKATFLCNKRIKMGDSNPNVSKSVLSETFMKDFNSRKDAITNRTNNLSSDGGAIEEQLSEISSEIQKLSKSLHDAVMFLPSYSVKIRQNEIRDLEKLLKEKEDELVPKKKFGFKSKCKPIQTKEVSSVEPKTPITQDRVLETLNMDSNFFTIDNLKHQTVQYDEEVLNDNDVLVKDSENSIVVLSGGPSTLRLANLKNCTLLCGPVHTSIFINKVFDSTLYLCCQQLRTHSSEKLDIYLRVASRAIIEDCTKIRFGPYQWDSEKSEELHQKAGIASNLERYDAVDDFNWLSASQSPNWSVIPDNERKLFCETSKIL